MPPYTAEDLRQKNLIQSKGKLLLIFYGYMADQKVCDVCRSKKLGCDNKRPSCGACTQRGRQCSWPKPKPCLAIIRGRPRGPRLLRPLFSKTSCPPAGKDTESVEMPFLMNLASTSDPFFAQYDPLVDYEPSETRVQGLLPPPIQTIVIPPGDRDTGSGDITQLMNPVSMWNSVLSHDGWRSDPGTDDLYPTSSIPSVCAMTVHATELGSSAPFAQASDGDICYSSGFGSPSPALSDHHIPATNSMPLNREIVDALNHYQTTFSMYRTTKEPEWSTHRLLLNLSEEKLMIMNFILAVSINDVCYRQEAEASEEARQHFKTAIRDLVAIVQDDSANNYVHSMAGFLFLYLYLPKQRFIPPHIINQLSITVRDFVRRHKLDSLCLEHTSKKVFANTPASPDRHVLARLIIWTFDEDVKCGFQGSGGYLAEYLTAYRERTMAVYEVSRVALQAHWNTRPGGYPASQKDDDDDNARELEFLWVLTALWQDINELTQKTSLDYVDSCTRIEQRFSLVRKVSFTSVGLTLYAKKDVEILACI
jgi:hypothetical protein